MALEAGRRLGSYEVVELLGAGGMGEVYRARDTHLGRDVALKVLPAQLADDRERLERFEREARLLASLNHPNVATLYGLEEQDGTRFLVMELVEGETLAHRLARGRIGSQDALPLFEQIAHGLEAAHDKGVIHRDLKPANIMITAESRVKLLDFGLAKAFAPEMREATSSHSPTVTRDGTETGVILGTAAYMSPEQARGQTVDKRTDVWAFGCCLYEALTGKPAFLRKTVADTLAGILEREPDWSAVPTQVKYVLQRTLRKDSRDRMHDIGDVRILLEDGYQLAKSTGPSSSPRAWAALALIALTVLGLWALLSDDDVAEERSVTRARIPLEEGAALRLLTTPSIAISPDGQYIAYIARADNSWNLYLRSLSESKAMHVPGSAGARSPFFSADSRFVAFYANGRVHEMHVTGDAPRALSRVSAPFVTGAAWLPSGEIVFGTRSTMGLMLVDPQTGGIEPITEPNRAEGEKGHRLPDVLPRGNAILFTSTGVDITSFDDAKIRVLDLGSGTTQTLIEGGTCARYSASGHILYYRNTTLFAVPFDPDELRLTGPAVAILTGVASSQFASAEFAIAQNGTLAFAPGRGVRQTQRLVWIDDDRVEAPLNFNVPSTGGLAAVSLSPDENSLVVETGGATEQIWVYDLVRGTPTRLTLKWDNLNAVWSPDSARIAFSSNRNGPFDIYVLSLDTSNAPQRLTTSGFRRFPTDWLPDGKTILFEQEHPETGDDIWMLHLEADRAPDPFLQTPASERRARTSPNGRFVAYDSDESGRREVYVRSFRDSNWRAQVSARGGQDPRWRPDGSELLYFERQDRLMSVQVSERDRALELAKPVTWFDNASFADYDISKDGRLIAIHDIESESEPAPSELEIVLNFAEELKRLAPPTN